MMWISSLLIGGWTVGLVILSSNPSPYFAALSLMISAGCGGGILTTYGASFLSLVLFLIYLGGMLVVFAYSAALAAEPYPEILEAPLLLLSTMACLMMATLGYIMFLNETQEGPFLIPMGDLENTHTWQSDTEGAGHMYSDLGTLMLLLSAWALLATLYIVLELTRGQTRGSLRGIKLYENSKTYQEDKKKKWKY
uniref:NADH-ubiquinone oxidoreductase chain 6 n=1 Tax=Tetrabrachium ocellatum TaxID=242972 RepID=D3KRE4_TETOC|nr:NADH dehydrogenase subunit 6 [Tetrabrachium ocellatum]